MTKFTLSSLTVAVVSTLVVAPSFAKDFVFKPGDDGVNTVGDVVYYKLGGDQQLSNGDNITQNCVQGRIFWDTKTGKDQSLASDLALGTVKVTNKNNGYHSGVLAFYGYTDSNYKVTVDQVILGYNTSLQVFDDMKEDQLTINKVVVNNDVPDGMTPEAYEKNKEQFATQIEVFQTKDNGKDNGKVGATMNIGELTVEDGRIVALTNRGTTAPEAYIKNTHLNIGKVSLKQGSKLRSGYSAGGADEVPEDLNEKGIAWSEAKLSEVEVLGDAVIDIDNGTLDIGKITVTADKTLNIETHKLSATESSNFKTEALLGSGATGVLAVHLDKNSTLDFNAKTVVDSKVDVTTVANAPGKVLLGKNASLKGEDITVTGLDVGATGNLSEDLKALASVVTKDQKGLNGIKVTQQATDIYDGGSALTTENGDLTQMVINPNANINGIAEMTALGLHIWRNEINDMNKRLGELRDSSAEANGVWARVYNGKAKFGNQNITNKYTAFQFGYDHQVAAGTWLGGALSWTDGNNDFAVGGGDSSLLAFTGYGSKLWDNGMFLDVTGKVGRMKNEFDISLASGKSSASYHTNAVSVSAEAGWRLYPMQNSFYVEPQVELMYGHVFGVDYSTSTGVNVEQDSADTLIGRAGVVLGLKCPDNRGNAYLRASVLHDWKGDADFTFSKTAGATRTISEELGGTWYEYGIGANFNATKQVHLYADVEAANGGEVDTDYRVNFGVRYSY